MRKPFFVCLALLLLCVTATSLGAQEQTLQLQLNAIAALHHGKVALFAENLKTGETAEIYADQPVPTASVIKLTMPCTSPDA